MTFPRSLWGRLNLVLRRVDRLGDVMARLAEAHGDATFVTEEGPDRTSRVVTFEDAARTVERWSIAVHARIGPGRPVVVAMPNGVDQFLACLAVSRAGGVPAPVNPQMSSTEVDLVVQDSGAALVLRRRGDLDRGKGSRGAPITAATPDPDDVAALYYTSGTTGRPKGAALSHRGLVGQASIAAAWPSMIRRDEIVMALPVSHIMGFVALLTPAMAGVPVYLLTRFSPTRVLEVIEERRSSAFIGVPAMYRMMLEAGAADRDLTSVRLWMSGADVMPADLARRYKSFGATAKLPGIGEVGEAMFAEGYGMVEVGGSVAAKLSPPLLPIGLGESLGFTMPGWRFRVVDESGAAVLPGQVGELLISGPGVLKEYWGDRDATADALTEDGWLRTGDLARSGPFGTVVFAGRAKAVIKSGGYSVYPLEVEADLEEHPDVLEAAVVGLPDDHLGELPVAAVRLRPGASTTPDELVLWSEVRMAHYKAPRRVIIVDDLPRTGTRKVQRNLLIPLFTEAA